MPIAREQPQPRALANWKAEKLQTVQIKIIQTISKCNIRKTQRISGSCKAWPQLERFMGLRQRPLIEERSQSFTLDATVFSNVFLFVCFFSNFQDDKVEKAKSRGKHLDMRSEEFREVVVRMLPGWFRILLILYPLSSCISCGISAANSISPG